jgi:carbon storage regulator CsrA
MLVLSRREQESIVFPKLGIRIEVTRIRGKAISVGIEAPESVRVLRGEIATLEDLAMGRSDTDVAASFANGETAITGGDQLATAPRDAAAREREHELRNRINTLTLALHLIKKKASRDDGLVDDSLLSGAIDELALIEEALQDSSTPADLDQVNKKAALPMALIIDDNENENALMSGFLRQFGFRVTVALDGEAALRLLRQATQMPDIVLLDMNMPGLDGRGTIEAIRMDPKTRGIRVFAVSGENRESCDVAIGGNGVDRWFQKPVRPDFLVQEMARGIGNLAAPC